MTRHKIRSAVLTVFWLGLWGLSLAGPAKAAAYGEALTGNLLANPGFEEIHRVPPSATDAHRDATKLGGPVKWVRQAGKLESAEEARAGKRGARLETIGGKEARIYSGSDNSRVRPGVSYVLSIWAKGKGELNLSVYQYDDANFIGSEFFLGQPPLRLTDAWQELRRVYTRPNDKVRKVSYSIALNGECAYIDDAWFGIDGDTPVELLPNGGFERAFDEVMFEGWQLVAGGATLRERQARTGERALRLTAQAEAAETRLAAMPPVYVNTAATYRLGAWGRGTGTLRLEVAEYDAAGTLLRRQPLGDKADVKLTDNWQQATATYRPVHPAARRAALTLVLAGVGAAAVLDDASFGFVFKENPGVDPFEPPPAKDLSVTVETRDAAATLYANGKPVAFDGAKGTIRLGEGVMTLALEAQATGGRPGIRVAIAGQAETDGRWRVGAVEAGRARESAFNDAVWPLAATDSDGFAWAGDKQAKDVCFRQTLLWNDTHNGPDSCLFPKTREWGFSRGSFDHLGLMLYPPVPGATADYEFVLDVPRAFTLFGKQAPAPGTDNPQWGQENVRPASVAEESVTRDGRPYRRYRLRFDARQLPVTASHYAGAASSTYLPLRLEKGSTEETTAFYYRRQARGNVTELEQRIPVRILPAIAGRQPRRIMISGYADTLPFGSMLSADHLEAVMDQAKAMGWNQAGLSIHDNWGKHFGDYWRGMGRLYAERGIRPMLSDGTQFPLQTSNTAGGSYRLTHPPLVNYVAATPAAQARWFKDSVKWDAKTRNTYCPTFMLGAGREKFRELVGTVIADLQKLTPGAQVHLLDYEAHSWASPDGTGSLCFCDRCKESFRQFAKLPADADLSDDAIFKNCHAQWDDFHVWQVMEVHKLVKEVDNELGLKLMAFTWGGWMPFEGRLKGRVDLYFAGTPGNDPASGANQERMDDHARFLRGEQSMEQVMGQRFSFLRIGDRREPTVMSPDGLVDAQSWKSQVLRIVAALGGGVDLQASKECVAGMPYWIGEATRIIATYEDLFIDGERTDKLAESAQLKYPDLLVLKKGDERLVLLFNEGNADMKVTLRNRELKPEHKAQVFESGRWQDAGELEVVVPARDAVAVHIAPRPSPSAMEALPCGSVKAGGELRADLIATHLRCEYLVDPLGIDVQRPRLSWHLMSQDASERGQRQTAYQILVASTPETLARDIGDRWDSGRVPSDESIQVEYAGTALASGEECYWKVRNWDAAGLPSPWSDTASWSMGLLLPADWTGDWITGPSRDTQDSLPLPLLRKPFKLGKPVRRAMLYIASLGYHRIDLNGRKVGDHEFDPVQSDYSRRVYYVTHDITRLLMPGENVIAVGLGKGWYCKGARYSSEGVPEEPQDDRPALRLELVVEYNDGSQHRVTSDSSWKAEVAPVRLAGGRSKVGGDFGIEVYDARREQPGWNRPGFDDSAWKTAETLRLPPISCSAQMIAPNRVVARLPTVTVGEPQPGQYLLDFGKNLTGRLRMKVAGSGGAEIKFVYYASHTGNPLKLEENFKQADRYICRGAPGEEFSSQFNWRGFRFVLVTGLERKPSDSDAIAELITTDLPGCGMFECSEPVLNRLHELVVHTHRCITLGGIQVDCPHRERLGYGAEGLGAVPQAVYNFDAAAFYAKWARDFRDGQDEDSGRLCYTAPFRLHSGGGPAWSGACIMYPWNVYLFYGDKRALADAYPAMRRWLTWLDNQSTDGLLRPYGLPQMNIWQYLGDWASPRRPEDTLPCNGHWTSDEDNRVFNDLHHYMQLTLTARIAAILGHADEARAYQKQAAAIREAINRAYFDPQTGRYTHGEQQQTYLAFPLLLDIVPAEHRERVLRNLVDDIVHKRSGHLDYGVLGGVVTLESLIREGRSDLIYGMISQPTWPSYRWMMDQGATTLWEHWRPGDSSIHNSFLAIGGWFYSGLAGIIPDPDSPGFRHVIIHPQPVAGVTWAKAAFTSMYGAIESRWLVEGSRFQIEVAIPPGSTATIYVPTTSLENVTEGGKPVAEAVGVQQIGMRADRAVFQLQSGRYSFVSATASSTFVAGNGKPIR